MNIHKALSDFADALLAYTEGSERVFAGVLDNEPVPGRDDLAEYAEQPDPALLAEARGLAPCSVTGDGS